MGESSFLGRVAGATSRNLLPYSLKIRILLFRLPFLLTLYLQGLHSAVSCKEYIQAEINDVYYEFL